MCHSQSDFARVKILSSDFGVLEDYLNGLTKLCEVQAWIDSGVLKFSPKKIESIDNLLTNSASIDYRGFHVTPGEKLQMNNQIIEEMWNSFNNDQFGQEKLCFSNWQWGALDSVGYAAALPTVGSELSESCHYPFTG
ncbi:MAG: hypothetical protein CM15mP130_2800 [Verrucomicrobiota bacterium]|nr:MAG: hypothetical protein CM15mP130_2800 [Verrucomicrobiota bacterium]